MSLGDGSIVRSWGVPVAADSKNWLPVGCFLVFADGVLQT